MKKYFFLVAIASAILGGTITALASGPGDPYPDVDDSDFYSDAAYSMRILGIMSGYEDGNFGGSDPVTRGQAATMFDRYNDSLLNPPGMAASGIYPMVLLICSGEYSEELQWAYDETCSQLTPDLN